MQVSVESTGNLERRMTVAVPEERIEKEIESRLKRLSRTAKIKGFRPGKVPLAVVQRQYGDQVRQEVVGEVVQSTFYEAVVQEKLRPAGYPEIEPKAGEGAGFEYIATFEVYPEIALAPVAGVKIEKPVAEVVDADVDAMLETIRKQRRSWEPVKRKAAKGDRVVVDFTGTIDGEGFPGNEGKNVPVELGAKRMIDGFEEKLVGAKAGEELTLDLTFPESYQVQDLAGKPVQFAVKVQAVEGAKLPELDDEFAAALGVDGGLDALRAEVRANMERELAQTLRGRVKEQVMDKLLELNPIEVPRALIQSEAARLADHMRRQMISQGVKESEVRMNPAMFEEDAERRVRLGLVLAELVKVNDLKAEPDQVRTMVDEVAATYEHPEEVVKWYYADKQRLTEVESAVLEERVVEWVLERADVSENKLTFDGVVNPAAA